MLRIKQLVFDEGLTLSGARRRLEEDSGETNGAAVLVEEMLGDRVRDRLQQVKTGLQSILELLSKDGERQPELQPGRRRPRRQEEAAPRRQKAKK